jgi:hypothetical protein
VRQHVGVFVSPRSSSAAGEQRMCSTGQPASRTPTGREASAPFHALARRQLRLPAPPDPGLSWGNVSDRVTCVTGSTCIHRLFQKGPPTLMARSIRPRNRPQVCQTSPRAPNRVRRPLATTPLSGIRAHLVTGHHLKRTRRGSDQFGVVRAKAEPIQPPRKLVAGAHSPGPTPRTRSSSIA